MPLFFIYKEMIYLRQYIENNGIILKRNVDSNGNLFAVKVVSEHKQIYKGTVMLEGIPSEFHRVFIEGYTENIPARDDLPVGTYNVDYNNGKVYFNPVEEGKFVKADYYNTGVELIKSERVITKYLEGENFVVSLAEEIRQCDELKDALLKELEANPKIRIVESREWVHEVESDEEQSFLISETIFNPVTDLITVFYNGDFLHANKYTKVGCRIILNDWKAVEGDVFSFIIYKHVVGTVEIGGDGSLIIDGTVSRLKLSEDVQEDLALIPIHNEYLFNLEEKLRKTNERVDVLEDNVERLGEVAQEHERRIDEAERTISEVRDIAENTAEEVDGAKGEFGSLKDKMDNIEEKALDQDIVIGTEKYRKLVSLDEDGEVNAHIDINGASFKELSVNQLNCDNVISIGNKKATTIEIGENDNIQQIINELPKYLLGNLTINVSGVHYGDINLHGFMGIGELNFFLNDGAEIHGSIYVNSSTTQIIIQSNECKGKLLHDSTRESAVRVMSSPYVNVHAIEITAKCTASKNGVYASQGAGVRVGNCKINGFLQYAYYANQCSRLYAVDNTGNDNEKCYYVTGGSTLGLKGKSPMAINAGTVDTGSQVLGTATMTGTITGSDTPVIEAVKTKTYGCASMKSYRSVDGWKTNNRVYMGKYNSSNPSSYNYYGLYVLGTDTINAMKSDLTGKTIKSVKMTIKRNAEGGLDTTGVSINIYGTTNAGSGTSFPLTKTYKTNIGKIKKGSEYTVTMPTSLVADIIGGAIKSIMLYRADQTNYSIFAELFELEVTYV